MCLSVWGSEIFWKHFDYIDFIYITFMILMKLSATYSKAQYIKFYDKSLWENDFNLEKFNSLFKNLSNPIIKNTFPYKNIIKAYVYLDSVRLRIPYKYKQIPAIVK